MTILISFVLTYLDYLDNQVSLMILGDIEMYDFTNPCQCCGECEGLEIGRRLQT